MPMVRSIPRSGIILLLLAVLAAAAALSASRADASTQSSPDLHVHTHEPNGGLVDFPEGSIEDFEVLVHNDGDKPAGPFTIRISVPSLFPASIQSVTVIDAPAETEVNCVRLSSISVKCSVSGLNQHSSHIRLGVELLGAGVEGPSAAGSVTIKTIGPQFDNPEGERNKKRLNFNVLGVD